MFQIDQEPVRRRSETPQSEQLMHQHRVPEGIVAHELHTLQTTVVQQHTNSSYERFRQSKQLKLAQETDLIRAIKEGSVGQVQLVCDFVPANTDVKDRVRTACHYYVSITQSQPLRIMTPAAE